MTSQYTYCRWYDVHPRFGFLLNLVRLMPAHRQRLVAERMNHFLASRSVMPVLWHQVPWDGHRWYDAVPELLYSLERLKQAPQYVQAQSVTHLANVLADMGVATCCA